MYKRQATAAAVFNFAFVVLDSCSNFVRLQDWTFVCPTEIIAFSDRHSEFEALGAQVKMQTQTRGDCRQTPPKPAWLAVAFLCDLWPSLAQGQQGTERVSVFPL